MCDFFVEGHLVRASYAEEPTVVWRPCDDVLHQPWAQLYLADLFVITRHKVIAEQPLCQETLGVAQLCDTPEATIGAVCNTW